MTGEVSMLELEVLSSGTDDELDKTWDDSTLELDVYASGVVALLLEVANGTELVRTMDEEETG